MQQIKRSRTIFVNLGEESLFDIEAFLSGKVDVTVQTTIVASSLLTSDRLYLSKQHLLALASIPSGHWSPAAELIDSGLLERSTLDRWIDSGFLLSDSEDDHAAVLRRRDELLSSQQWNEDAAFYHFMTTRRASNSGLADRFADLEGIPSRSRQLVGEFIAEYGSPPPPFLHRVDASDTLPLPLIDRSGPLYEVLKRRHTTRLFNRTVYLELKDLSTLLRYTFGAHGQTHMGGDLLLLSKTSPSGGSLHPIEAYPLVIRVDGLEPGFYHYDVKNHGLERLAQYSLEEAEELAAIITRGQSYAASAHVLVIMTARFFRNYWKYRRSSRTYSVLLMDIGHLSQTFYLVATELGLGAFFSAAIDNPEIDRRLELEPFQEGSLAISGCGILRSPGEESLELLRQPFRPRQGPSK